MKVILPERIRVLPSLDYECSRCGLRVSHNDNADLVRRMAAGHNAIAHERSQLGDIAVRWPGFTDGATIDRIRDAVCDAVKGRRVDVWVDQFELTFSSWKREDKALLDDLLGVVARFVGPELDVVYLR